MPIWLTMQFNSGLFRDCGLCAGGTDPSPPEAVGFHFIGLCGGVLAELPADRVLPPALNVETAIRQAIAGSAWHETLLRDGDFGPYTKSDLFHALNTDFILPTQMRNGPSGTWSSPGARSLLCGEVLVLSHIRHIDAPTGPRIDYVKGAIPAADEFHLWGDWELLDTPSRGTTSLLETVRLIVEAFLNGQGSVPDGNEYVYVPGNPFRVPTPSDASGLIKYHSHLSIEAGSVSLAEPDRP